MINLIIQKSVVIIALIILPLMSFADAFPFVKLTSKDNKIMTLRVGSASSDFTQVKLKDQFGQVLYSESVKSDVGILKNFDLSNLESGKYSIELESEFNIQILPIVITWDSLVVANEQFTTLYKPFINMKVKGIVDLNYLNLNKSATTIIITDLDGNVIYNENLGKDLDFKRRYDISNFKKGEYLITVETNGRFFNKTVAI